MARKSLGAASSGATDVPTRAEVQALIAAAGGGGSSGAANPATVLRPPINGYTLNTGSSVQGNGPAVGQLNLGPNVLPSGTYDRVLIRCSTQTANAAIKIIAYEAAADNGLGSLLFETPQVSASSVSNVAVDLASPLVIPAGGKFFWVGVVNQGSAIGSFWCNQVVTMGFPRVTQPAYVPDVGGTSGACIQINSVSGAAPTSPSWSYVDGVPPARVAFRRSA